MKQLFDGVFLLQGEVSGRPLQLMYLRGSGASMLLDTGCAGDSRTFIIPQITEAGGNPEELTYIINTHPDLDHTGGNAEMMLIAPGARLGCGDADRELCGSFETLFHRRYNVFCEEHGICLDEERYAGMKARGGSPRPVDITFTGGERITLSEDWVVEVLALPGHAKGHLGILDPKHRALYGGDAIHGRVYNFLDGGAALPPTYLHVDDYLQTIRFIEHLPIETYVGCHWPVKRGTEIAEFCAESRQFVLHADELLKKHLSSPRTLKELCSLLGPELGDWQRDVDGELVHALSGHLERLVERGSAARRVRDEKPRIFEYYIT